jgi:hypothetical protein
MNTLTEGQIVYNYGKEFIARNVKSEGLNKLGEEYFTYDGECTKDSRNDDIRSTDNNGARYSWRASDK